VSDVQRSHLNPQWGGNARNCLSEVL